MARKSKSGKAVAQAAQRAGGLRALLGPAPLLEGEDRSAYDALHDRIIAAVRPEDALDEILTRDIVDLTWEILRLRRIKVAVMEAAADEAVDRALEPAGMHFDLELFGAPVRAKRRDPRSVRERNLKLEQAGFDREIIAAQAFAAKLVTLERIDRLIMQAEARRNVALREIDRHRSALAERLRALGKEIEDAEFTEVDTRTDAAE